MAGRYTIDPLALGVVETETSGMSPGTCRNRAEDVLADGLTPCPPAIQTSVAENDAPWSICKLYVRTGTRIVYAMAQPGTMLLPGEDVALVDYIPRLSPERRPPYHLADWCESIEACLHGGVRALCEVPIRHWKSETTYHGIAWILKRDPSHRILVMVADHDIATDRGKRIRQLCEAAGVGPERGMNVIVSWRNSDGGGVQIMSAAQSKLGQDVDTLIFDDPISETDALDRSVRDAVDVAIAHYTARAGRDGRRGNVLGIMSRWHPDDPIGRRKSRRVEWRSIHAAAISVDEDGHERAFAPDVMSIEELHMRRSELKEADPTERIWHAQFQNDPQPDVIGLFKNPARYTETPASQGFRVVIGADLAYSSARHADYFALVVLKIWPEMVREGDTMKMREVAYLVDCRRERWDPAQCEAILRQTRAMYPGAQIYSYMSGPETGIARYLEDKAIPIQVLHARYSKRQRAQPAIDLANAGRIRVPESAPWAAGFVSRMILFSGDEKAGDDDEIDALASAVAGGMAGANFRPKALGKRRI